MLRLCARLKLDGVQDETSIQQFNEYSNHENGLDYCISLVHSFRMVDAFFSCRESGGSQDRRVHLSTNYTPQPRNLIGQIARPSKKTSS